MAFIYDRVKLIDSRFDQIQAHSLHHVTVESSSVSVLPSQHFLKLRSLIQRVATNQLSSTPATSAKSLADTLEEAKRAQQSEAQLSAASPDLYFTLDELRWQLLAKVAAQTYGIVLDHLLSRAVALNEEMWYWNDVLGSRRYTALYTVQMSPWTFYDWSMDVVAEVRQRRNIVAEGWKDFYDLVRSVVRERSMADVQKRIMGPIALAQSEVRGKRNNLKNFRSLNAGAIGYLMSNCFGDDSFQQSLTAMENNESRSQDMWKAISVQAISVIDAVLEATLDDSLPIDAFDDAVSEFMENDELVSQHQPLLKAGSHQSAPVFSLDATTAAERLHQVLSSRFPHFLRISNLAMQENQRPSALARYWLPATALLLSSSTLLRIALSRRSAITQWIRDLGATTIDFWYNWVIEPAKKVVGTIRHDESSEVSLMSKRSLEGDRASLERMVVDFAVDNPEGSPLSDTEIAQVRANIREGDLTPVLRAYEKELQSPVYSSLRGNLIRALLIQIQKTKVDVEIAMGGIDALLKSQELVFGFVGLTPGILVCVGVYRWLSNLSTNRATLRSVRKQSQAYNVLRNIDRILTASPQSDMGYLSSQEYGSLVCEAVVLRDVANRTFPKQSFREFLLDFDDLIDRHSGVGRQIRVADRIRWAYARWL